MWRGIDGEIKEEREKREREIKRVIGKEMSEKQVKIGNRQWMSWTQQCEKEKTEIGK